MLVEGNEPASGVCACVYGFVDIRDSQPTADKSEDLIPHSASPNETSFKNNKVDRISAKTHQERRYTRITA